MRAPRPTLLIYNNDDNCCFRAPLVKPYIFDAVMPFFKRLGAGEAFSWHENLDPGDHNYYLDNRIQAYRFFSRHFGMPLVEDEMPVSSEVKDPEQLTVGVPRSNLTILSLAKQLARDRRGTGTEGQAAREDLREVIRFRDAELVHTWGVNNSKRLGVESETYRFEFSDQLSAAGVWLKTTMSRDDAPVTVILNDLGRKESSAAVSARLNRGEQIVALDLLFRGDVTPNNPSGYTQLLATTGDRALGIQVSHLESVIRWVLEKSGNKQVRLEANGIRSQITSQLAAALNPSLFTELVIDNGMASLGYLLDAPIPYEQAPDLFCLDLFAKFDIDSLAKLAEPVEVRLESLLESEAE